MGETGVPLSELLDQETIKKLSGIGTDKLASTDARIKTESRGARKDLPYAQLLKENPQLAEKLTATLQTLSDKRMPMPIFHVTARALALEDGREVSTGYVENIMANGFRPRNTNVAALMERGNTPRIASPGYFQEHPERFLRELSIALKRYRHHGTRTNKVSLEAYQGQGTGIPTMVVVDSRDVRLVKGTDYDNHFILENHVPADHVMGQVDLKNKNVNDASDLITISDGLLTQINGFLEPNQDTSP